MPEKKKISVVFRYDDFSSSSPDEVDGPLIDVFIESRMVCTFAVIPLVTSGNYRDSTPRESLPLSQAKLEMLKKGMDRGALDIALHGTVHRTLRPRSPHTEFSGLGLAAQIEKLSTGKAFLEERVGASITVFVPPWNDYDINTLRALERVGIPCLSANREGIAPSDVSMKYLPITIELQDLRGAVIEARRSDDPSPVVAVLMHPYDFKESGDARGRVSMAELQKELGWLSEQVDIEVSSISALVNRQDDFGSERYRANAPFYFEQVAPPFVKATTDRPIYLSRKTAEDLKRFNQGSTFLLYIIVGFIAGLVGYGICQVLIGFSEQLPVILSFLLLAGLGAYILRAVLKRSIFFKGLLFCVSDLGLLIGNWIATY